MRRKQPSSGPRTWEHIPDVFGVVEDISDALITREQNQFLLTDAAGNVPAGNRRGLGLYSHDTRHLSGYELLLDGAHPIVLLSTADSGFTQDQVLGNHRTEQAGRVVGRCTVELQRQRVLNHVLEERLRITNFNTFPVTVHPSYVFDADFADIFEVRGHKRAKKGTYSRPEVGERSITYAYLGIDGVWRRTRIEFDQRPEMIAPGTAGFRVHLGPRESAELSFRVLLDERAPPRGGIERLRGLRQEYALWQDAFVNVHTDNEVFNKVLGRSLVDLRMLWTQDRSGQSYMAAGTPWFATLFGRDSIITSLQTLPFQPEIARNCLAVLARHQGQSVDAFRCEEPGKILHEVREDELSVAGELPYQRYYGSVDATPLFLLLAAEYFHWTADRDALPTLLPAVDAGLRWLRDHGDRDHDGFIEYATDSADGLRNQGWKDSGEAIMHADGRLCEGPIAMAEVQGYVYAAYLQLARLFQAHGDGKRAGTLVGAARDLRERFGRSFWLAERGHPPMALDGAKQPAEVMSSNAGQVLWSGIVSPARADQMRRALFQNDMFSGWGIRTLSTSASSYYPLGYHVGSIWPHDNGIIALGLKRYGFDDEVNELATALFDAAQVFPSYRLPELFGGQPRSEYQPPVPYTVACRPQAWTAGAWLHLLAAMLGMVPDAANGRLYLVRPKLPYWLRDVHLSGLRLGKGRVDLHVWSRRGRTYTRALTQGDVTVEVTPRWPRFDAR